MDLPGLPVGGGCTAASGEVQSRIMFSHPEAKPPNEKNDDRDYDDIGVAHRSFLGYIRYDITRRGGSQRPDGVQRVPA
jgi:hypothetical protein